MNEKWYWQNLVESFDDKTRIVLINAVYLKAQWKKQFEKDYTKKEDFHLNENKKIKVDMMNCVDYFGLHFFKELDADVLVANYEVSNLLSYSVKWVYTFNWTFLSFWWLLFEGWEISDDHLPPEKSHGPEGNGGESPKTGPHRLPSLGQALSTWTGSWFFPPKIQNGVHF